MAAVHYGIRSIRVSACPSQLHARWPDGPRTADGSSDEGACDLGYWPATAVSPGLGGPPGAQKRAMFCSRFSICALDRTNSCRQNSYTCIRQHTSAHVSISVCPLD